MRVADPGKGVDGTGRGLVEPRRRILEEFGRLSAMEEVEFTLRIVGHILIHADDLVLEESLERGLGFGGV